jgi:hypothetical protein
MFCFYYRTTYLSAILRLEKMYCCVFTDARNKTAKKQRKEKMLFLNLDVDLENEIILPSTGYFT